MNPGHVREQDRDDVTQEMALLALEHPRRAGTRGQRIDAIRRVSDSRTFRPTVLPLHYDDSFSVSFETPLDWMVAEESVREFLRRFPRGEPSPHWLRFEFARRKSLRAGMV